MLMDKNNLEREIAKDLCEIQNVIGAFAADELHEGYIAAGPVKSAEELIQEAIKRTTELRKKYAGSKVNVRGFSVSVGAILVNTSISVNFEF